MNDKLKRVLSGLIVLMVGLLILSGCGPRGEQPNAKTKEPPPKQEDYPKLEGRLFQLAIAEDPIEFARQRDLDHRVVVRVLIELESPDSPIPDGICVEGRFGKRIEALVPIDRLLTLSQEPQVKAVRTVPPIQPDSPRE
jgi:hypothetical protein